MKFQKNKFLTTIAAVALALAVGACSSNGDDEMSDMDVAAPATTDPAPELTAAEQLTAAQGLVTAAQAMVTALTNSSTADDAAAAYAALGAAQTALHAANSLPENQIAAKQEEIDALQAQVDQLKIDLAEATKEPEGPTAEEVAATAAATKAAGTKVKAIGVEADQDPDAGLGGSLATGVTESTYSMTIERPRSGTVVKIADTANATDDDPKFEQAMDFGDGRTMHVRAMEADADGNVVEEVVIVSTDIAAPVATAFAKVAGQELTIRDLDEDVDAGTDGVADNDFTAITVEAGTDDVNLPKIMSAKFAASSSAVLTFDADDDATDDMDKAFETAGTYNGAMGTYRCGGDTDCTVTLDAKGAVTGVSDGWVFTPDAGATSDVADADYLNYGFWLKRTTDEDGVLTYNEVETFADSSVDASDVSSVEGRATYNGGATGVYVKNVQNSDGTLASATSGHFSADARTDCELRWRPAWLPDDQFTIGGTIDHFGIRPVQHGEENDWAVGLGLADLSGHERTATTGKSASRRQPHEYVQPVWLQVTARLSLVRGMECSTVPRRKSIMTWTTPRILIRRSSRSQ